MRENENFSKPRLDMAYGNPSFLQEPWQGVYPEIPFRPSMMPYKLGKSILPELEANIKKVHKLYKNAQITKKSHIVVTVGAVQALSAAMYYYKQKMGTDYLYVPTPYWGRFDNLAAQQNIKLINQWRFDDSISVAEQAKQVRQDHRYKEDDRDAWFDVVSLITSPNNPDGKNTSKVLADIRDACYNWPQYTKNVVAFSDEIVIFSLSKASGHSSTRIGWAITKSEEAALAMQEYVELFTSGVSIEAQTHAAMVLEQMASPGGQELVENSGKILRSRHKRLKSIVDQYKMPIEILSKEGMFWYISCRPQEIFNLKIMCFEGGSFGDAELDEERNHRYRLNLGVNSTDFEDFAGRLEHAGKLYK